MRIMRVTVNEKRRLFRCCLYCRDKRYLLTALVLILFIPALMLQGCLFPALQPGTAPPSQEPPEEEAPPQVALPEKPPPSQGNFTLRYDPNSTLNPITSLSSDNILLCSLMYEPLFILDSYLNAEPLLCESWEMDGEYTFIFEVKPDIAMSDGSFLTAEDVVYTLRQAMRTGLYENRLRDIESVTATGELTVRVDLKKANSRFIYLLDVPIIKNGSIDFNIPPGTGPYIFAGTQFMRLDSFTRHRDFTRLPVMMINLRVCDRNEMAELFDDGELTLLWDDPSDTFEIRLNRLHEKHYYDTTALQFIGFNMRNVALRDPDVRRAVSYSIDRQFITENILPRQALASPLALSPAYRLYDPEWERTILDPLREMSRLLYLSGLEDINDDSFLEYPDGFGGFADFSIDFIVNNANLYKIQIANMIAEALRRTGINITVRELSRDQFMTALETGDFDMYYGEIVLSADFDFSPLLLPGGKLDYGGTGDSEYDEYISDFLFMTTDYGEETAAKRLCDIIRRNAPIVPVVYKRYVVYTPMGAIFGMSPCQSGVFRNFTDWTIDFTMLS